MNLTRVDQIAKAVLYEGYMLYPYRPSSVKNRQRFNFGVIYPQVYSEAQGGIDPCRLQAEFLAQGNDDTTMDLRLRFLHMQGRDTGLQETSSTAPEGWREAIEREVVLSSLSLGDLCQQGLNSAFSFPQETRESACPITKAVHGVVDLSVQKVAGDVFKIKIQVYNDTPLETPLLRRDDVLMRSLVSAHVVVGVELGHLISLLEPPDEFHEVAASCENVGVWPVLVGDPGQHDTMLASPIILYDYPQIAPESTGDLFDGTEIDEILSLRIMTLTDEEKQEIRASDARARQILERTENMPAEQFMKLHGAVRSLRPIPSLHDEENG